MGEFPSVSGEQWRQRVEQELGAVGLDSLSTATLEGIRLAPLYPDAAPDAAGFPGVRPFERGSRPARTVPPWLVCQSVADPDPEIAAAQIAADRRGGSTGLWLRLDECARLGLAPDAGGDEHGCGLGGLTAYDGEDLAALLRAAGEGPLRLRLDAGGNALPAAALLSVALERIGRDAEEVDIHLGMDPLAALAADGALPAPADTLAVEAALLARRDVSLPWARPLTVSSIPYTRAGAHPVQALALAMASAIQYLRWLEEHGVEPRRAAARIDFVFEGDRDLLIDVCKLRAARALWSRVQAACGVEPGRPWIHAVTGRRTLTCADPWTNILRVTVQCVAAVLGGADAITTLPFDTPMGRSDALGRRVARNTQAILAAESGLGRTLDPFGGAAAVESLTEQLARRAWELLQDLEGSGGILACLRDGQVHSMLADTVARRAERAAEGVDPILGVTAYPADAESESVRGSVDRDAVRGAAVERLERRRRRSGAPSLEPLSAASYEGGGARLWSSLVEGARSGATVAELSAELRPGVAPWRAAPLPSNTDEDLAADAMPAGERA